MSPQEVESVFQKMMQKFIPEKSVGMDAIIQFNLANEEGDTSYWVQIQNENVELNEGVNSEPQLTITANAEDYMQVVNGDTNAMQAFMSGKLKVDGQMALAMKLQSAFDL